MKGLASHLNSKRRFIDERRNHRCVGRFIEKRRNHRCDGRRATRQLKWCRLVLLMAEELLRFPEGLLEHIAHWLPSLRASSADGLLPFLLEAQHAEL